MSFDVAISFKPFLQYFFSNFAHHVSISLAFHFSHNLSHNFSKIPNVVSASFSNDSFSYFSYFSFRKLLRKVWHQNYQFFFFIFRQISSAAFFKLSDAVLALLYGARDNFQNFFVAKTSFSFLFFNLHVFNSAIQQAQSVSFFGLTSFNGFF